MEWPIALLVVLGGLLLLMATGLPVAFCFMVISIGGAILLWNGIAGLQQMTLNMWSGMASFVFLPIPMYVLLGEILFRSGVAAHAIDVVNKLMGRIPGRLALVTLGVATLFATLTGTVVASTALLGKSLLPEMDKHGYKRTISIGSIIGSAGLAMIIPPSGAAVLIAAVGGFSVGRLLISGITAGLMMATGYAIYIVGFCLLNPAAAPAYEVARIPLSEKVMAAVKHVLPLGLVVLMVTGLIFLGFATPEEAACMGVLAAIVLAAAYGNLSWRLMKESLISTLSTAAMVILLIAGATGFSQILAHTGATQGMSLWVSGLSGPPIMVIIGFLAVVFFLGMFMSGIPITLICIPIFMPIIRALGYDPVWFGLLFLINSEIGTTTPPFGMILFVMKAVAPEGTTMAEIVKAGIPFIISDMIVIAIIVAFPVIALWLPNLMIIPSG